MSRSLTLSTASVTLCLLLANVAAAQQVTVYFVNHTNSPAHINWLYGTAANAKKSYGTVTPGGAQPITTYIGHAWELTNGRRVTGGTVFQNNQQFVLGTPPGQQRQQGLNGQQGFNGRQVVPPRQRMQNRADVNQRVVAYAKSVVGRRIGNGQCTELAIAALRAAGAKANQGYAWGRQLQNLTEVRSGDIIQLWNASFQYPDGSYTQSTGPHTAIVTGVRGTTLDVLEQNMSGSPVQAGRYDVNRRTGGTIQIYRPTPGNNQQRGGQVQNGFNQGGSGFNQGGNGFNRSGNGFNRSGNGFNIGGSGLNAHGNGLNMGTTGLGGVRKRCGNEVPRPSGTGGQLDLKSIVRSLLD